MHCLVGGDASERQNNLGNEEQDMEDANTHLHSLPGGCFCGRFIEVSLTHNKPCMFYSLNGFCQGNIPTIRIVNKAFSSQEPWPSC